MMKIETVLNISEKMKDGRLKEMGRVKDLTDDDLANLNRDRFKEGKSQRGKIRLESECFVILKGDFEDYEREINSQIQSLESIIADKDKSIESLQNRLSNIEEEHEGKLKRIDDEYSEEVEQLKADLHDKDLEIERTRTRYEKEIGEFKEDIQKQINKLELFDEDKHMKIADHQKAMEEVQIFNPEFHMKREDHQKELNRMRGNCLKLRVRENKEYSSYIDELDNLGRLEKLMNKDKAILKEMKGFNSQAIDDKAIDVEFNLIDKNEGRADE